MKKSSARVKARNLSLLIMAFLISACEQDPFQFEDVSSSELYIEALYPSYEDTNVSPSITIVQATFTKELLESSLASNISVKQIKGTSVTSIDLDPGDIILDTASRKQVTINLPLDQLDPQAKYEVMFRQGIRSVAGEVLRSLSIHEYSTGNYDIGFGGRSQPGAPYVVSVDVYRGPFPLLMPNGSMDCPCYVAEFHFSEDIQPNNNLLRVKEKPLLRSATTFTVPLEPIYNNRLDRYAASLGRRNADGTCYSEPGTKYKFELSNTEVRDLDENQTMEVETYRDIDTDPWETFPWVINCPWF